MKKDCIIITIGAAFLKERGLMEWYRDFYNAMTTDSHYCLRQGNQPKKQDIKYVYLCIGGKIRYRTHFIKSYPGGMLTFIDGRSMYANAWVVVAGPMVKAPYDIARKGFQGFRYTEFMF